MLVREWMTSNPITVHPETSFFDAFLLMQEKKIHRLPVVDKNGSLVGIVTENDFLCAAPSPSGAMSGVELNYLLGHLPVSKIMTSPVITIREDSPIEQAAAILHAKKIGGLPVMQGNHLVGIITVTDLMRMIKQCFGSAVPGLIITIRVRDDKGMLAVITGEISRLRGNITHLISYPDGNPAYLKVAMKLQDVTVTDIIPLMTDVIGAEILSIHTWKAEDGPDFLDRTRWSEPQNRAKKLWFTNMEPN